MSSSPAQQPELILRRMQSGDLDAALKLTQAARWAHRLQDWQFHFQLGRGWVICSAKGAVLGTAMWWPYGEHFGTLGLIVVDSNQQGRGIGRQLVDALMNDAGSRVLQLVATPAGLKLYRQCGFAECGGIEQRQGIPTAAVKFSMPAEVTLHTATIEDLPSLYALDAQAFGADRSELIKAIFDTGRAVLAERAGRAVGYAMARASGHGTVIGPIVADTQQLAMALIAHHVEHGSGFMRLDIPSHAAELAAWLDSIGLSRVDGGTIMRRGQLPNSATVSAVSIFGLASQAFN